MAGGIALLANDEQNDNDAYSAFAQVDQDCTDRTTLGVWLRYDKDEREQTNAGDPSRPMHNKSFSDVQPPRNSITSSRGGAGDALLDLLGAPGVDLGSASQPDTYGVEVRCQFC